MPQTKSAANLFLRFIGFTEYVLTIINIHEQDGQRLQILSCRIALHKVKEEQLFFAYYDWQQMNIAVSKSKINDSVIADNFFCIYC